MNSNQRWNPAFPREKRNRFSPPSCINVEEKKRKRNLYNFVSRNFLQVAQRESLCCLLSCISFSTSSAFSEFSTATIHRRSTIHVWIRFSVTARICIVEGATRAARVHSALLTPFRVATRSHTRTTGAHVRKEWPGSMRASHVGDLLSAPWNHTRLPRATYSASRCIHTRVRTLI